MRVRWAMPGLQRTAIAMCVACSMLLAQEGVGRELRRWRWSSPPVLQGTCDAAGTMAALVVPSAKAGEWEIVLHDPREGRELRRLPVLGKPVGVRFRAAGEIEVRVPESNAPLSLSHWYRLRLSDGAEVGQRTLNRLEDDNPAERARLRGERAPGPDPCLCRDNTGSIWWHHGDTSQALTDAVVRATALTPDGRFAVVWLPTRLAVVRVAGGEDMQLPLASEAVRAIAPGTNGDEVLVVTAAAVITFRAGEGRQVRAVPHAVANAVAAAIAPGGGLLALACGIGADVVLLDLASGRAAALEAKAVAVAWSADGGRLVCGESRRVVWFARDGRLLAEVSPPGADALDYHSWRFAVEALGTHLAGGPRTRGWDTCNVMALDARTDALCWGQCTLRAPMAGPDEPDERALLPFRLCGRFDAHELVATTDTSLLVIDADTLQPRHRINLRGACGAVSVAAAVRRVATVAGADLVVHEFAASPK